MGESHNGLKLILQINQLLSNENNDVGDIQIQTNIPFQSEEEFKEWLLEWKKLIKEAY